MNPSCDRHDTDWVSFSDLRPPTDFRGYLLVSNNPDGQNAFGFASHVWLVSIVHYHDDGPHVFNGRELAGPGEITAFAQPGDMLLRNLTHWRPALAEEWAEYLRTGGQFARAEWAARRRNGPEEHRCPCDGHPARECRTCRGACSCHWIGDGANNR